MSSEEKPAMPADKYDGISSAVDPPSDAFEVGEIHKIDIKAADPAFALVSGERVEYTEAEGKSVLSKIVHMHSKQSDWHILPLLMWIYAIQFADKISLNYASLMGIRTDTHLDPKSQQYSWVSSIFYAGFLFWEFPTTYLLRRLPVAKYTSVNVILWGAVLACTAATSNYAGLLSVRFFLGLFEATVTPAFVLITSMWYKQNEQARRIGYWLSCNGITLILMGVIGYGLSAITGSHLASWKILFLILGPLTCVTGIFCFFFMPDNQANASFLNPRERQIAVERIRDNFQGIGSRVWKWYQFREAFKDPRTYLYVLFSLLMNIPNGGITTFGSLVVSSFGFGARNSLLLGTPSGVFDTGGKLFFTWISDKYMDRTAPAFIAILFPMVGGILMITTTAKPALLIGYYMISVSGSAWGLVMVLISNNTLGYTKKATVSGLQIIAYGCGNWIGPQTFRAHEAPNYSTGKTMVAIMYGLSALTLLALRLVNVMENRRRNKMQAESGTMELTEEDERNKFLDLTDFEQPHFRYVL